MRPLKRQPHGVDQWWDDGPPYREVWGFRRTRPKMTFRAGMGKARAIAWKFLQSKKAKILNLKGTIKKLRFEETSRRSLGGWHVIYRQFLRRIPVYRAYVSVHLDNEGRVYLAYGRTVPLPEKLPQADFSAGQQRAAKECALKEIARMEGKTYETTKLSAGKPGVMKLWFAKGNRVWPAFRFWFKRCKPGKQPVEYIAYVNSLKPSILGLGNILKGVDGLGRVFDPNPVAALGDHRLLLTNKNEVKTPPKRAYRPVILRGLRGEGCLDGIHVTTDGTTRQVKRSGHKFYFKSTEGGFEEVMAYYHIDSAVRYLEDLGYWGSRKIFRKPVCVDAWSSEERANSEYDPNNKRLKFGYLGIDGAEDGETILHEFGHALQDAICPRFGQSKQAQAIGEGFSDYLAASFFAHKKPPNYQAAVMTWNYVTNTANPPCARRVDNPLYYKIKGKLGYSETSDKHTNGMLWSTTLWDIWQDLGRERADILIIESHFQLDGYTTFARAARAILDADQNLYDGSYRRRLLDIFYRRGFRGLEKRSPQGASRTSCDE